MVFAEHLPFKCMLKIWNVTLLKMSPTSTVIWINRTSMVSWHLVGFLVLFWNSDSVPCCFEIPSSPKPENRNCLICMFSLLEQERLSPCPWSQRENGKNMNCGEEILSAVFALFFQSSLSSQKYFRIKVFFHLYSTPQLSSCTKSLRGWWKRKGMERMEEKEIREVQWWIPSKNQWKGCWCLQ